MAGCCCGTFCCGCSSVPNEYDVTTTGITDGTCSSCDEEMNRTWELFLHASDCEWLGDTDNAHPCNPTDSTGGQISCDGTWVYLRWSDSSQIVEYRKSQASWSCLGSNTLDLNTDNGKCAGWPATLTVTPV